MINRYPMIKQIISVVIIVVLISSCKSTSKIKGEYRTESSDNFYLNFDNNKFVRNLSSGSKAMGKFKTVRLSDDKILVVCNDLILGKTSGLIENLDDAGDSVTIGAFSGYKDLGSTLFEITISKDGKLAYRRTYTNEITNTITEGNLVRSSANSKHKKCPYFQ